jgi:glyoxylate utilization-related uncharacterized protein
MFAEFDQRINKQEVIAKITVRSGSRFFSVREASEELLSQAKHNAPEVRGAILRATSDRWVAFALKDNTTLDYDSQVTVVFPPGLVSTHTHTHTHTHSLSLSLSLSLSGSNYVKLPFYYYGDC